MDKLEFVNKLLQEQRNYNRLFKTALYSLHRNTAAHQYCTDTRVKSISSNLT